MLDFKIYSLVETSNCFFKYLKLENWNDDLLNSLLTHDFVTSSKN